MGLRDCVQYIIENFESKYEDNIRCGLYDQRDLDRLHSDLSFGAQFVRSAERLDEGVELMHGSLKFRKEIGLNDITEYSFTKELWDVGGMYYRGRDMQGTRIYWLNVRAHRRDAPDERNMAEKQGLIFGLERAFKENPRQQIVVCLDMYDTGIANLDLGFVKYILDCFRTVYPTFLSYFIINEMPWIFNAAWKVVKAWLNEETAERIKFVSKNNIQDYVSADNLPPHCGGTDEWQWQYYEGICDVPLYPEDVEWLENLEKEKEEKKKVTFHESLSHTPTSALTSTNTSNGGLRPRNLNNNNRERGEAIVNGFPGNGHFMVSPAEYLHFEVYEGGGDSFETIELTNTLDYDVVYKVKTTSPEKYRVRPSSGVVVPGSTEVVHVYLVTEHAQTISKDKFLVMAVDATGRDTSDLVALWKEVNKSDMMEHKLRCSVETLEGEGPVIPAARSSIASTGKDPRKSQQDLTRKQTDSPEKGRSSRNLEESQSSPDRQASPSPHRSPRSSVDATPGPSTRQPSQAKVASNDEFDIQIEKLEKQNEHMQKQLNLLLVLQVVTGCLFLLMMFSYSCFGEELFTRFLALPFDFCGDKYGRKC